MTYTLHLGKCIDAMRAMPDNSVDSIVTDPPYGLRFMGKRWDYDVPGIDTWVECLRVLKPGGHLLAFAGTRTQHRMAVRIEDAGFEIRDMIAWVYGSGFPKSLDVSKAIAGRAAAVFVGPDGESVWCEECGEAHATVDMEYAIYCAECAAREWQGWGTALKPALEPITLARKPLIGTVAANVLAHGAGALNINGCRVASEAGGRPLREVAALRNDVEYKGNALVGRVDGSLASSKAAGSTELGRWPANLIHDGSDVILAMFPAEAGAAAPVTGTEPTANGFSGAVSYSGMRERVAGAFHGDKGSAARFFYCAKTSRKDRNDGLDTGDQKAVSTNATMRKVEDADWPARNGNHHPTVKPTDLMAYLCRLVTPTGGVVLDPFMGSGSTGKAAMREGFQFIGCELDPEYLAIAKARIEYERTKVAAAREAVTESQLSLFGN